MPVKTLLQWVRVPGFYAAIQHCFLLIIQSLSASWPLWINQVILSRWDIRQVYQGITPKTALGMGQTTVLRSVMKQKLAVKIPSPSVQMLLQQEKTLLLSVKMQAQRGKGLSPLVLTQKQMGIEQLQLARKRQPVPQNLL